MLYHNSYHKCEKLACPPLVFSATVPTTEEPSCPPSRARSNTARSLDARGSVGGLIEAVSGRLLQDHPRVPGWCGGWSHNDSLFRMMPRAALPGEGRPRPGLQECDREGQQHAHRDDGGDREPAATPDRGEWMMGAAALSAPTIIRLRMGEHLGLIHPEYESKAAVNRPRPMPPVSRLSEAPPRRTSCTGAAPPRAPHRSTR